MDETTVDGLSIRAPFVGYTLLRLYSLEQHYEFSIEVDPDAVDQQTFYTWDWTPHSEQIFGVLFAVYIEPTEERPEQIRVLLAGNFRIENTPDRWPLEGFLSVYAPIMVYQHAKQIVSSLTARGLYGPYFLPTFDPKQVLGNFDFEKSRGTQMLRKDPKLAAAFGLAPDGASGRQKRRSTRTSKKTP